MKETKLATSYLDKFSTLIRTTLDFSDEKEVSLYDEISYLIQYIEIENLRKQPTVTFECEIAEGLDITQIQVVPMLLQSFVENSLIHAFPPSVASPKILLKVQRKGLTNFIRTFR